MLNKENAPHYSWRSVCEGWTLAEFSDLSVIHESMPAGTNEVLHLHLAVRQLYFVLAGWATVEIDDTTELLDVGEATIISPGTPHRIINRGPARLEFLVVSSRPPRQDRLDIERND